MNKVGVVLGVAVVATLAGCKDPDYVRSSNAAQNEVKNAEATEVQPAISADVKATPAPASNDLVKPIVVPDEKPVAKPLPPPPPEYTVYIVQRGDFLGKIALRYGLRVDAIRKLNPNIKKGDVIWVGMKLKLPGKIDVGEQKAPVVKSAAKATRKSAAAAAPFKGATKEYVVKNGDSLGAIALQSGISVRQLKELNGLSKNNLRIGQKLKVPATKVVSTKAKKVDAKKAAKPAAPAPATDVKPDAAPVAPADAAPAVPADAAPAGDAVAPAVAPAAPAGDATPAPAAGDAPKTEPAVPVAAEPAAPATFNYVVQEGDDIPGVAIRWGVTSTQIRELNKLSDSDQLVAGQVLKLPAEAQQ